jgi:dihydrofolate reductase
MANVVWDVTMSLDGFTSGPNVRAEEPMGDCGENLHTWMAGTDPDGVDAAMLDRLNTGIGAVIIGRRTFDLGLKNWGGTPWPNTPSFVITHRPRENLKGDNAGEFAFGTLEDSVRRAREAADDKKVMVLGADVARQLMRAGQLDQLWLHVCPMLLGGGTPMFAGEHETLIPIEKPRVGNATHYCFRVGKS